MTHHTPLVKISDFSASESTSPRSEEFQEGLETKQYPFFFQANETIAKVPYISCFDRASKNLGQNKPKIINHIEAQAEKILKLKTKNFKLREKIDENEARIRKYSRLRIILREKDCKIKELEESLDRVTNEIKDTQEALVGFNHEKPRVVASHEYYASHPPRRIWAHPAPELLKQISKLKEILHKSIPRRP
jgi:hypothetical protein